MTPPWRTSETRKKRAAAGLCIYCGDEPARPGRGAGEACAALRVVKRKAAKVPTDDVDAVIQDRAAAHHVPVIAVLASSRAIARARREIVVALTACGLSQVKIAKRLGLTLHGVQRHQAAAAIEPAGRKAA